MQKDKRNDLHRAGPGHAEDDIATAQTAEPDELSIMARGSQAPVPPPVEGAGERDTTGAHSQVTEGLKHTLLAGALVRGDHEALQEISTEHFSLGAEIARGGMGRIVRARDHRLGRAVAIKELLSSSRVLEKRFEREIRITARLQHPAIISVYEAGRWPSGVAFFAMKEVEGKPLDKVIDATTTLAERMTFLPNVIDVAEALAYAHDRRVIHRDLKPGNVLIGDYGETVVIDWGLAKDLGARDEDDTVAIAPSSTDDMGVDLTRAGEAMGTPAYMPPEQARGQAVDERADVYAMGAMLYHLLSGAMPFSSATNPREILDVLLAGPPTPLGELEGDIPDDLLTIVERSMARSAADRYSSAKQLAAELRRFQAGRQVKAHDYSVGALLRRWLRKHRTAVTAVSVMLLVLIAVIGMSVARVFDERDRASRAQLLAESNQGQVEDLMTFMLSDLGEKLKPLGKIELLDMVAANARDYYASRAIDWTRPGELRNRSTSLGAIGNVLRTKGNLDEALKLYRQSLEISERLAQMEPSNTALQINLAQRHLTIGDTLATKGDLPAALRSKRAAASVLERTVKMASEDPTLLHALAVAHHELGDVLKAQGDLAAALERYKIALAKGEQAAQQGDVDDGRMLRRRTIAVIHEKLGDVHFTQGDLSAAMESHRAAESIRRHLVQGDQDNTELQRELSLSQEKIGDVYEAEGKPAEALASYRASKIIAERLVRLDPANATWQRDLSVSYVHIGTILRGENKFKEALDSYQKATEIGQRLVNTDPHNTEWQHHLSVSYELLGDIHKIQHELSKALTSYRTSQSIRERLVELDPSNTKWLSDLSLVVGGKIGSTLRVQGDLEGGLEAYRDALAVAEGLAKTDPANTSWQRNLAWLNRGFAELLLDQGKLAEALTTFQASRSMLEELAAKEPGHRVWQELLTENHFTAGNALKTAGHDALASEQYAQCSDWDPAHSASKDNAHIVATCFALTGDTDAAFVWLNKAVKLGLGPAAVLENDADFSALRSDSRWPLLLRAIAPAGDVP